MALVVRELDTAGFPAWDAYVESMADATFFHRCGWKTVLELEALGSQSGKVARRVEIQDCGLLEEPEPENIGWIKLKNSLILGVVNITES